MKHPSSRTLFEYWERRRGTRPAPERSEIEPGDIRHVLGDVFVLAVDRVKGHPFRLAGTRVCALFGHELKGEAFVALWEQAGRHSITEFIGAVTEEKSCIVASATAQAAHDPVLTVNLELLLLPLAFRWRHDARLIGALSPMGAPYWLGAKPVGPLHIGGFRYIGGRLEQMPAPSLVAAPGRLKHGLTVYEGGRTD